MKSAILQLNTRYYYRNCYTENAGKTQLDGPRIANLLNILTVSGKNVIITYGFIIQYVPTLHTKADQHFGCEDRSASDLSAKGP